MLSSYPFATSDEGDVDQRVVDALEHSQNAIDAIEKGDADSAVAEATSAHELDLAAAETAAQAGDEQSADLYRALADADQAITGTAELVGETDSLLDSCDDAGI